MSNLWNNNLGQLQLGFLSPLTPPGECPLRVEVYPDNVNAIKGSSD
jgi:hypothetical protein